MKPENVLKIGSHIEMQAFDKENYLIINNHTEKYLKINSNFYKLIKIIDGTKTSEEIIAEFNLDNSQPISKENSEKLIEKLESIGLFNEENLMKKKKKLPEYLTIGFVFIPKEFVAKLVPFLKFLFDKKVKFFSILFCISFLSYLFYRNFTSNPTYNFANILIFFFFVKFISTMFHELGHATATHFYKAKHGGIGFGLYLYFMPVFFADVTDIWRLDRWKRIVVNVSGVYFEIIFCGILAICSVIFHSSTLFAIASILSITTLYNLLPYFRMDGYWVLSDYINQPNLMATSFKKGKDLFLFKFKNYTAKDFFLAFYGIFNFSMIVYFIGFMLVFHFKELISFPSETFHFLLNLNNESFILNAKDLFSVFPILIVYFFSIRILISLFKKYILKIKTKKESPISIKSF